MLHKFLSTDFSCRWRNLGIRLPLKNINRVDSVTYFPTPSENTHLFFLASISSLLILFFKPIPLRSLACSVSKCSEVTPNTLFVKEIPVQIQNIILKMTHFYHTDWSTWNNLFLLYFERKIFTFADKIMWGWITTNWRDKKLKSFYINKRNGGRSVVLLTCIKSSYMSKHMFLK